MLLQCINGPINSYQTNFILCIHDVVLVNRRQINMFKLCRHNEYMYEGFWFTKTFYSQNNSNENLTIFLACIEKGL